MSTINFIVDKKEHNLKIREHLKNNLGFSTRLIRGAALDGRIKVNSKIVKLNYVLKEGDNIEVELSKDESQDIEPQNIPIDIVYEDEDILVANKPPYIVVHPTRSHKDGTLANGILYHFKEKGENCIVRLVSRLDMNTSGLIIIAKNQFSHMALSRDMQKDSFKKYYKAIVHGNMQEDEGTLDLPIYKPSEDSIKRVVDHKGQKSITHFKVIERFKDATLVELLLETGRTHQIRVHLSHINHPIFGDTLYGEEQDEELINRQALHAYKLEIPHPRTGDILKLQCDLPEDMKNLIHNIK